MSEKEAPKDVQIMHHNDGFSVVYLTRQPALRRSFDSRQAAVDAVASWNRTGDFRMSLSSEVLDVRYNVDEERAKMGLKPLAEEQDGQYWVEVIMFLKPLASPSGSVTEDISKLDVDGDDAKSILRQARAGLKLIKQDDPHLGTLQKIIDFAADRTVFDGNDAKAMLQLCQDGIEAVDTPVPGLR